MTQSPIDEKAMPGNHITLPTTGPLTIPSRTMIHRPAHTTAAATDHPGAHRITVLAATLALIVGVLLCAFALPARAATVDNGTGTGITTAAGTTSGNNVGSGVGSGVGAPATHSAATQPPGSSGELVFAGLCIAGILATAGGVLWYTVRTRRTLD